VSHVVAPLQLGCCPDEPRCLLCPPPPHPPTPEYVSALVQYYRTERAEPGDEVWAAFYGGPPPSDALLRAAGNVPKRVRVRPDLLSRDDARRVVDAGVTAIELDAVSFDDRVLREARRPYRAALLDEMLVGLRGLGVRVGVVLWPGLPGSSFESSIADARHAAPLVDTARLHPALVLRGSALQAAHIDGLYRPLELGEAVTVCRAMMDVLEEAAVQVIRVGLQPGPDGYGKALAGPRHPALRELVEARRTLEALHDLVDGTPPGTHVVIRCAPPDEARTRGPFNQHIRDLRARFGLSGVQIRPDPDLPRGAWAVTLGEEP